MEIGILPLLWIGTGIVSLGFLNATERKQRKEWDEKFGPGGSWARIFEANGWEPRSDPYPLSLRITYIPMALLCVAAGPLGIFSTLSIYGYNGFTLRIPL